MLPRHVLELLADDGFRASHPAACGAISEAGYHGLRIRVISAPKARAYRPGPGEVAISIRGRGEPEVPLSSRFAAVLRLVSADVGEFAAAGDTADSMTAAQAEQLATFVHAHRDAAVLVLHCAAGVSRSRSAAAGISTALDLPYQFTPVNDEVYRAVIRAFVTTAGRRSSA